MGRPAKTYEVLMCEGKSHRTKRELEARKNSEKSLLTGEKMRESAAVRADKAAHGHWLRVKKLMAAIGRDDAIHENGINRYCLMLSECEALLAEKARLNDERDELRGMIEALRETAETAGWDEKKDAQCAKYEARCDALLLAAMKIEAALEKKRAMLLSIEKENLLTVAAGLRAVPKKPPEEQADSMAALLGMRPARRG